VADKIGTRAKKFRFKESSAYERARMHSDGQWYCNKCNKPASTEHKKEECHLCSDWNVIFPQKSGHLEELVV
jgi:rubrerythrin